MRVVAFLFLVTAVMGGPRDALWDANTGELLSVDAGVSTTNSDITSSPFASLPPQYDWSDVRVQAGLIRPATPTERRQSLREKLLREWLLLRVMRAEAAALGLPAVVRALDRDIDVMRARRAAIQP